MKHQPSLNQLRHFFWIFEYSGKSCHVCRRTQVLLVKRFIRRQKETTAGSTKSLSGPKMVVTLWSRLSANSRANKQYAPTKTRVYKHWIVQLLGLISIAGSLALKLTQNHV